MFERLPDALPSRAAMKKKVHRIRAKVRDELPAEPSGVDWDWDLEFFKINGEQMIVREWKFWDEKKSKLHRVTLVSTVTLFTHFCRSPLIQSDSTFDIVTKQLYKQFYTVHGSLPGNSDALYPLIFGFFSGKSQRNYESFFKLVIEEANQRHMTINFRHHLSDFEIAIPNAIKKLFPEVENSACYFHLNQNIMKRVKELKLYEVYRAYTTGENVVNTSVRALMALAFLPAEEIRAGFDALVEQVHQNCQAYPRMFELLDFFRT